MIQLERIATNPFWAFAFQYVFWALLLFGLIYIEDFSPLIVINNSQTDLSVFLTSQWVSLFDIDININGALLTFEHDLKLLISNECNGLAAFLLTFAAILAYPTQLKTKIFWSFLAYFILLIANSIRLDWIAYHVIENPEDFKFAHEVLGRYVIASIPLVLFYIFSANVTIKAKNKSAHFAGSPMT